MKKPRKMNQNAASVFLAQLTQTNNKLAFQKSYYGKLQIQQNEQRQQRGR